MKTALTIAGSDSSGGAGIQADIKTMTANGVFAMSAITALTAQNTTGVTAIFDTTPQFLAQQLDAVFTDIYPDAVKIGMVSSAPLIDTIAERLHFYGAKHIVVDPVMVATSGAKLLQDDAVQALTEKLLLFGGALLVISLILLSNTIRLAIFSKRYLINTMKLVGATKWFIMRPFLGSSLTQGILAGTAASALFGLAVYGLNEAVPELMTIAEAGKIAIILGSMIAGGIIISGLFTFAALNKFINMKSNKIYLY